MKFTKGLFVGTALGISAAMMMNNKSTNSNASKTNNANNANNANSANNTNNANNAKQTSNNDNIYSATGVTAQTEVQTNDYIENDII